MPLLSIRLKLSSINCSVLKVRTAPYNLERESVELATIVRLGQMESITRQTINKVTFNLSRIISYCI